MGGVGVYVYRFTGRWRGGAGWLLCHWDRSLKLTMKCPAFVRCRDHQKGIISMSSLNLIALVIGFGVFATTALKFDMKKEELIRGFIAHVVPPGCVVWVNRFKKNVFVHHYDWVLMASELAIASLKSYATLYEEPRSDNILHILFMWSPLSALLMVGVASHTTFWGQLVGQFISTVTSHFWIYPLCSNPHLVSKLTEMSNGFFWHLESSISTVYLVKFQDSHRRYPCAVSLFFFHVAVGFLIPCAVKYLLESHQRANYLYRRLHRRNRNVLKHLLWENVQVALRVTVFFPMGSWALLHWLLSLDLLEGQCPAIT